MTPFDRLTPRPTSALRWRRTLFTAFVGVFALLPLAQAELWAYVDSRGVTHFAEGKVDDRYQLFQKNSTTFDPVAAFKADRKGNRNAPINLNALENQPTGVWRFNDGSAPRARVAAAPISSASLNAFNAAPHFKTVRQHLSQAAKTHQVDADLLKAMMAAESGFNASAVSPKGAVGLMQIMPATAERYGLSGDGTLTVSDKLADPKTNIGIGARYMAYLMRLFPGQLDLAVAAYNAGEGAVQRAGNRIPNYPETQKYVARVLGLYDGLKGNAVVKAAAPAKGSDARVRVRLGNDAEASTPVARDRSNSPLQLARSNVINLNAEQ